MRNFILLMSILLTTTTVKAEGLNANASYIKNNYPTEYEQTLKKQALQKWNDDYEMVVYMINNQADDLIKLIAGFKSDNTNIVFKAIQKWSIDGYKYSNVEKFKNITTFELKQLIPLHCDWEMVKYEYDNQVKAKNSF
ncbi:MAG: hypothetical protein WC148_04680 [Bacilli bacterium]